MKQVGSRSVGQTAGIVLSLTLSAACGGPPPQPPGAQAVPVEMLRLQPTSFQETSEFVGQLEAEDKVDLKPEVEGRITRVFVAPGDPVASGQPVIQLSPNRLQAEVAGAEAGVAAARSAQRAAAAELEAATARLSQAESDAELAEIELGRTTTLVAAGALSQQDLNEAQNRVEVTTAQVNQAEEAVQAARAEVQRSGSNLESAVATEQAERTSLADKTVAAPISGIVGDIPVKVGDFVNTGQTVTSIIENEFLLLRVQVPSNRIDQLRVGLPVELIEPNASRRLGVGSISFISPEVNPNLQSILIKARFPNEEGRLREAQFVTARIIWETTTELMVPTTAVTRLGGQNFVYVVDEQSTDGQTMQLASQRPVQLGEIQGDSYRVINGVEAGESVVITNILKLQDGVPVETETQSSRR